MPKKIIALLIAILLIAAPALAETIKGSADIPGGGSLHLRAWPGTQYMSMGFVHDGDAITIHTSNTGKDSGGEQWTKITVTATGESGYIKNKYISMAAGTVNTPSATAKPTSGDYVHVGEAGGSLVLRNGPGTAFSQVGYVQHGDAVKVLEHNTTWSKITVISTGKTGFIKTQYIRSGSGSVTAAPVSGAYVYVGKNGGSLTLRQGPASDFDPAGYIQHGDAVKVHAKGETWAKVTVTRTGQTGYVKNDYIRNMPASTPVDAAQLPSGTYTAAVVTTKTSGGTVNLRTGAGTGYASAGKVSRGAKLLVLQSSGGWHQVKTLDGRTGWISGDYVAFNAPVKTFGSVNFRTGPGTGYGIIAELTDSVPVTLHSVSGKWAKVTVNGASGYLHIAYLNAK